MVVLTHLWRRWSLSGREGFEFFSPIFYCAGSQKRNGGERRSLWWPDAALDAVTVWPDASGQFNPVSAPRVNDRTLVWPDQRVRSVHLCAKVEWATSASGPSRNRRVRSGVQRGREQRSGDRTRGASGHVWSDASGRDGSLLDSDRMSGEARPVIR
jgi:hypothetical protein